MLHVLGGNLKTKPNVMPGGVRHFTELTRILKPHGNLIIGECLSRIRDVNWLLEENYDAYGLSKQIYLGETLKEFIDKYGIRFDSIINKVFQPFFITLTKSTGT